MASLQGDGELGRQHLPAGSVDHRREINKAFSHRDAGSAQRSDLVGSFDPHSAQEIVIDLVTRVLLAGSRFPVQRFNAHAFHQRTYPSAADFHASPVHLIAQHACAHEWTLQMQLVQAAHQLQVGLRNRPGAVIGAATPDADQFGLSCQRQVVLAVNYSFALSNPTLVSASSQKIVFQRQLSKKSATLSLNCRFQVVI